MEPVVEEAELRRLVETFYGDVRRDAVLGPLFENAIRDWPAHFDRLTAFWSSVMLGSGRYKGNPFAAHVRHREAIDPAMFDRWLGLWREATERCLKPEAAALIQTKADRIAESIKGGLFFRPEIFAVRGEGRASAA